MAGPNSRRRLTAEKRCGRIGRYGLLPGRSMLVHETELINTAANDGAGNQLIHDRSHAIYLLANAALRIDCATGLSRHVA